MPSSKQGTYKNTGIHVHKDNTMVIGNVVYGQKSTSDEAGFMAQNSTDCSFMFNTAINCGRGLHSGESNGTNIISNRFINCTTGLYFGGASGAGWVGFIDGNDFYTCTTDVGGTTSGKNWGMNKDQNGNWDDGVLP
jgi:hypothetical protein